MADHDRKQHEGPQLLHGESDGGNVEFACTGDSGVSMYKGVIRRRSVVLDMSVVDATSKPTRVYRFVSQDVFSDLAGERSRLVFGDLWKHNLSPSCAICDHVLQTGDIDQSVLAMPSPNSGEGGHTLVVPRRHLERIFQLGKDQYEDLWVLVARERLRLSHDFGVTAFNIDIRDGVKPAATSNTTDMSALFSCRTDL